MPYSDKPLKKHGETKPATMAKGPYMMSGNVKPPSILTMCGSKRHMGKKK